MTVPDNYGKTEWSTVWRAIGSQRCDDLSLNDHLVEASIEVAADLTERVRNAGDPEGEEFMNIQAELQTWIGIAMLYMGQDHHGERIQPNPDQREPQMTAGEYWQGIREAGEHLRNKGYLVMPVDWKTGNDDDTNMTRAYVKTVRNGSVVVSDYMTIQEAQAFAAEALQFGIGHDGNPVETADVVEVKL